MHCIIVVCQVLNSSHKSRSGLEIWWNELTSTCRLMQLSSPQAKIRISMELLMTLGALLYIVAALREASFLGGQMFIENLVR